MSTVDDEEVDAFGRVLPKGRKVSAGQDAQDNNKSSNENTQQKDSDPSFFMDYGSGEKRNQNNDRRYSGDSDNRKRFRPDDRRGSFPNRGGGGRFNRGYNNNRDHRGSFDRRGPPHRTDRDSSYQTKPPLLSTPMPRVPVLESFKSFIQKQHEDLSPEVFQKRYDDYQLEYLRNFSDAFFRESLGEEWFHDRYNPVNLEALEKETSVWAAGESGMLKKSLLGKPRETMRAMCLDDKNLENEKKNDIAAEKTDNKSEEVAGSNFSGHEGRTIYITGIPAACPKSVLEAAITTSFTAESIKVEGSEEALPLPAPERVLIAQPTWSVKYLDKFERSAWVVMPTPESVKQAVRILKDLEVQVPGPPLDPLKGDPSVALSFKMQVSVHLSKRNFTLVPFQQSHPVRVQIDTIRALELADILDKIRLIPEENQLKTILSSEELKETISESYTNKLDIAVCYLRRVHFVSFYAGKRYRNEAHMLALAPSVLLRGAFVSLTAKEAEEKFPIPSHINPLPVAFTSPPPPKEPRPPSMPPPQPQGEDNNNLEIIEDKETGKKRKFDDVEEGKDQKTENETEKNENEKTDVEVEDVAGDDGNEVQGVVVEEKVKENESKDAMLQKFSNYKYNTMDRRVEAMILELRAKVPPRPLTMDEEEAQIIIDLQEKVFEETLQKECKFEKEGKCRCCYPFCNKLFKGVEFLRKHLKMKHEDFCRVALLNVAEPYMRKRYDLEELRARPLPPVQVENSGRTELKSVQDILDKCLGQSMGLNIGYSGGKFNRHNGNNRRWSGDGVRKRYHEDNFNERRRSSHGGGQYVEPKSEDNFSRQMSSYMDVDAPKETAVSIDYGVTVLPPVKRRKVAAKK